MCVSARVGLFLQCSRLQTKTVLWEQNVLEHIQASPKNCKKRRKYVCFQQQAPTA